MKFNLKRITAKIGISLLILLTAVLLIRAVLNFVNGKRMTRYLENMRTEGIPLALQNIEPDCPPGDNAARGWKAAEELLIFEGDDRKFISQIFEDLFYRRPMDEEKRNRIRKMASKHQAALRLVLEAAKQPCFKYAEEWNGPAWELSIQNAVKEIAFTRLFCLDAVIKAEDGQIEEAIEQCLELKRFLKTTLQEPTLISYLISVACAKHVTVSLQKIVSGGVLDEKILEKIIQEMDPSPWQAGLVWAWQSERIMGLELAHEILKGNNLDAFDFSMWESLGLWIIRPVLKNEVIYLMKTYDQMNEVLSTPFYKAHNLTKDLEKRFASFPWYYVLSDLIVPNAMTVGVKQTILEAMFNTVQIGAACKIYHNRHGRYPEKLSELTLDAISVIPRDPFTGKPFIYKPLQAGFLLYSLGSNQIDDGGRGTLNPTSRIMEKDDDWAWIETR